MRPGRLAAPIRQNEPTLDLRGRKMAVSHAGRQAPVFNCTVAGDQRSQCTDTIRCPQTSQSAMRRATSAMLTLRAFESPVYVAASIRVPTMEICWHGAKSRDCRFDQCYCDGACCHSFRTYLWSIIGIAWTAGCGRPVGVVAEPGRWR